MATSSPRTGEKRTPETDAICSPSKKQKLGDGIENKDSILQQEASGPVVRRLETSELAGTERANNLLRNTIFGRYLETVEVTVGPSRTLYTLHVRVLQDRCPGPWQLVDTHGRAHSGHADGQRLYHFAGDVDIIFKLFVAWMYTGAVPTRLFFRGEDTDAVGFEKMQPRGRLVNSNSAASDVDEFGDFCLVQLFYFGTCHEVLDLSNAALSSLAARNERRHCSIAASAVQHAYDTSGHQTSCNLLDFLVEDSARRLTGDNLEPSIVNFPGTFVQRVLKRTMGRKVSKAASIPAAQWPRRVCDYHFHTEPGMVSPCINKCLLPMDTAITSSTACYDLESTAFVSIGPEAVLFAAHEQKLCQVSEYFQKALCGAFVEGNSKITGKLTFPESGEYATYRDYLEGPRNSNSEHAEGDVGARAADSEVLRIRDRQDSESSSSESDSDEEDEDEDQDDSDDDSEDEEEVADTIAEPPNRSACMQKRVNHDKWRFREMGTRRWRRRTRKVEAWSLCVPCRERAGSCDRCGLDSGCTGAGSQQIRESSEPALHSTC
ncbi:hypothetical protein LTR17_000089 [Elasticomyces elasticus]|nr:hypothetical protein LTR17_000089 [Elasticomyces elasticus]